jgi:hypothetical protein
MKRSLPIFRITALLALMVGCDRSPQRAVSSAYAPSPDKDVTKSPQFNFAPFAGTVWKTKVKTAIADIKRYTGVTDTHLLAPLHFDPADPKYTPIKDLKIAAELPVGTRLRITRLLQDQGAGGGPYVEAIVLDGTNADKTVFVDQALLAPPAWTTQGAGAKTTWAENPDMLERAN